MKTYRKLFNEILKFRAQFVVSLIFGVIWSLSSAQLAIRAKPLFESLKKDPAALGAMDINFHDQVAQQAFIVLGFFLFSLVVRYWHMFLTQYTGDCVSVELRRKLNSKFL